MPASRTPGAAHASAMKGIQSRYAAPSGRPVLQNVQTNVPIQAPGAVYMRPNDAADNFEMKQTMIREGVFGPNNHIAWQPTEADIQHFRNQIQAKDVKDWDNFALSLFDIRTIEGLRHMKEFSPDTLARIMDAFDSQHELDKQLRMLKHFGFQTPEQLKLLYLHLQGGLMDRRPEEDGYIRGTYAPRTSFPGIRVSNFQDWTGATRGGATFEGNDGRIYQPDRVFRMGTAHRDPQLDPNGGSFPQRLRNLFFGGPPAGRYEAGNPIPAQMYAPQGGAAQV